MPAEPCVRQEPTISVHDVHDMKIAMVRRGIAAEIAGATSHEADERLRVNQKLQIPGSSHPHWNRRLERAKRRRIYYAASVPLEFAPKTIRSPSWPPSMMPCRIQNLRWCSCGCFTPKCLGRTRGRKRKSSSDGSHQNTKKCEQNARNEDNNKVQAELARARAGQVQSKRGAGAKRDTQRVSAMPTQLLPGKAVTKDGDRICYGNRMGTCTAARRGERCSQGFHVRPEVDCDTVHPLSIDFPVSLARTVLRILLALRMTFSHALC